MGQNNGVNSAFALKVDGIDNEKFMEQRGSTVVHQATEWTEISAASTSSETKCERLLYVPPYYHNLYLNMLSDSHNKQ